MDYIWKINMIDGKSYLVYSNECDLVKFCEMLLPKAINSESINMFKCATEVIEKGKDENYKFNAVVVIGSKVSTVEYYIEPIKN